MTEQPTERPYDWPNVRIVAESEHHSHLDWLDEFLKPSFGAECSRDETDYTVRLVQDAERYRQASEACHGNGEIDVFVQDTRVVRLPAVKIADQWTVFDKGYRTVYCVRDHRSPVEIVHAGTTDAVRGGLMRVVRELAMNHAIQGGDYILHAACVAFGRTGVIIAGPKGAGKTTMLVHLLGAEGVRYVANDRLLVGADNGSASVRGVPTIVCLREKLFHFFPGLRERLMDGWYRWLLTLNECSAKPPPAPRAWSDGRIGISPAQLCALVSRPPVGSAHPRTVVFPEVTRRPGTIDLTRLSPEETAARLYASLFAASHPTSQSRVFASSGGRTLAGDDVRAACTRLAHALQGFSCKLGRHVHYIRSDAELLAQKLTGE